MGTTQLPTNATPTANPFMKVVAPITTKTLAMNPRRNTIVTIQINLVTVLHLDAIIVIVNQHLKVLIVHVHLNGPQDGLVPSATLIPTRSTASTPTSTTVGNS